MTGIDSNFKILNLEYYTKVNKKGGYSPPFEDKNNYFTNSIFMVLLNSLVSIR
jgi:hypothetical protein